MKTLAIANTGGTDHQSFDGVARRQAAAKGAARRRRNS
jgi:hypothetical protein